MCDNISTSFDKRQPVSIDYYVDFESTLKMLGPIFVSLFNGLNWYTEFWAIIKWMIWKV